MTCASSPSKFANLAGRVSGLGRLAGQRAFYAGMAAGAAGTLGVQQVLKSVRRRSASAPVLPPSPGTRQNPRSIPTLDEVQPAPPRRIPALADPPGTREKPRPIPHLDRAPAPPRRIPALEGAPPGTRDKPRPIPSTPPTETKLKPEAIQVRTGSGQVIAAPDSYRVVRPDGGDTGLALTPTLNPGGEPVANSWGVTHTASGSLVSGPYSDLKQAQNLATQLSSLRWGGLRVPAEDVEQARQIITNFQPGGDQ